LIQILLESCTELPNLLRFPQVGHGAGNGVVVFKFLQGREFLLREFLDADFYILRQHEIKTGLLLIAEVRTDSHLGLFRPFLACEHWQSIRDMRYHVE
jgi:hypothetical protein